MNPRDVRNAEELENKREGITAIFQLAAQIEVFQQAVDGKFIYAIKREWKHSLFVYNLTIKNQLQILFFEVIQQ